MTLEVNARGLEVDAWLYDYIRTTVVFASWHYDVPEAARVRLDRAVDANGEAYVRCGIEVEQPGHGSAAAGATGPDVCTAVQQASDLLEVALHRPGPAAAVAAVERLAA
jgi:hypothetical protein